MHVLIMFLALAVAPAEEGVLDLPKDGGAWHLSLFLHDDWPDRPGEKALVDNWSTKPELVSIKKQVSFHTYTPSHPRWPRYQGSVPAIPTTLLQDASGRVYFREYGTNPAIAEYTLGDDRAAEESARSMSYEPGRLVERLGDLFRNRRRICPDGLCRPKPKPDVEPPVDKPDVPTVEPPPVPVPESGGDILVYVAIALALLGGAASLVYNFFKNS